MKSQQNRIELVTRPEYYQSIIPSSLFVSFVPIACIILQGLGGKDSTCQQQHPDDEKPPTDAGGGGSGRAVKKLGQSFVILGTAILGTLVFNQAIKAAFGQNADNHILDFVYDKLGINKVWSLNQFFSLSFL